MDLVWDNNNYVLAYDVFQDFKNTYFKTDSIPYVDKSSFKAMYPTYSINLTKQPQNASGTKSKIVLRVDFDKEPPTTDEGTVCYIVIVPKSVFHYDPSKDTITQEY